VVADFKSEKLRRRTDREAREADSFAAVARAFIEGHKVRKTGERPRSWREVARNPGLNYPLYGGAPLMVRGGLAERWAERPIGYIDGHDLHAVISESVRYGILGTSQRNADPSDNRGRKMGDALGSLFRWSMRHRRGALAVNPMAGVY
jgi:hypothetical protein